MIVTQVPSKYSTKHYFQKLQ